MFSRILSWSLDEMCRIHHTTSFNYTKPHMELAFEAETTPCGIAQSLLVLLRFVKTKYIMKHLKRYFENKGTLSMGPAYCFIMP